MLTLLFLFIQVNWNFKLSMGWAIVFILMDIAIFRGMQEMWVIYMLSKSPAHKN